MSTEFGVWIAALMTLGLFSFLYKDNPLYKVCEAIFIGTSAGYYAVTYFFDNLHKKLWEGIFPPDGAVGDAWLWGGAILGVLMLCRLSRKIGWIARWPLSFIVGATAGLYMINYFVSSAMIQVASTMQSLVVTDAGGIAWQATIGSVVVAVAVVSGLIYFFFSKEHTGAFGGVAKVGIWFLMITFGASFGYTVMSRMSLLIGRMDYLFGDWLGLIR
jgi:hypothetical protein